jgi:hypothetical protein
MKYFYSLRIFYGKGRDKLIVNWNTCFEKKNYNPRRINILSGKFRYNLSEPEI